MLPGLALISALCVGGCVSEAKIESKFDPKLAEFIKTEGTAIVEGHAFLKNWNGRAMHGVGEFAWLIPATPYAEERFKKIYPNPNVKLNPVAAQIRADTTDPLYTEYTRRTKAESDGSFRFEKVAPGSYFVVSSVVYKESRDDIFSQGGSIYERVTVTGKETKIIRVVLNGQ